MKEVLCLGIGKLTKKKRFVGVTHVPMTLWINSFKEINIKISGKTLVIYILHISKRQTITKLSERVRTGLTLCNNVVHLMKKNKGGGSGSGGGAGGNTEAFCLKHSHNCSNSFLRAGISNMKGYKKTNQDR